MASLSTIGAVREFVAGLPFAGTPPSVWVGAVPLRQADGSPVNLPWVVVADEGTTPTYDSELNVIERTAFRLEIFAATLAEADAIALAIKYGGGKVNDRLGLDFTTALPLTGGLSLIDSGVYRESERRDVEAARGQDAGYVHKVELTYFADCKRVA